MELTTVVNLHRDAYDVYIGREGKGMSGYFGNPVRKGRKCIQCGETHMAAGDTIPCFEKGFHQRLQIDPDYRFKVLALAGKRLGCFCKPLPCHGDVIAQWVNENARSD